MMSLSVYVHNNERYRHCCYCTCLYNSWFVTSTTSAVTSVVGTIVVVGSQQWSAVHDFQKYVIYVDSSSRGSRLTKQPSNCWQVYYTRGHPCTAPAFPASLTQSCLRDVFAPRIHHFWPSASNSCLFSSV